MRVYWLLNALPFFIACNNLDAHRAYRPAFATQDTVITPRSKTFDAKSWQYFLQHLPLADSPILDYTGQPITYQDKHTAVVRYDVGTADLQQCADVLMRLRAEYLFAAGRYNEIRFHLTGGGYYSWNSYCNGVRPMPAGNKLQWYVQKVPCGKTHATLRSYLNIVYAYANTISLAQELQKADDFNVGTVIIHAGSPGHCSIIIDETTDGNGEKIFKLAEGYMPAQSIYVLRNIWSAGTSPWYHLQKGVIKTASYTFTDYELKKFE